MAKPRHLLILAARPDVLERLYDAPLPSGVSFTVSPTLDHFLSIAQRHTFHGHVIDLETAGERVWSLYHEIKLRRPTSFFAFLHTQSAEKSLHALIAGAGGWGVLHAPYPLTELSALLTRYPKGPVILHRTPEAAADPLEGVFRRETLVPVKSLKAATETLAASPGALLALHVAHLDTALAAFVKETRQALPAARVLVLCDQTAAEAARHAARNAGWILLMPPNGVPFLLDHLGETGSGAAGAPPPAERVLVVDDEPNILGFVVDVLSEHGYEVEGFPSGTEAVAAMKSKEYHAALVDFQLGDMTGLTLSRELRAIDPDLNVILMTAHASLDMAVKAIQADVYDYLIKPVDTSHLKRSLGKALEKRRLALEIKALVADLQRANHELNRLNELKSRFLSIVTHDLRTPLTSIKGYSQVLIMQKNLPPEQQLHFLKVIAHETDHLAGLISDLMDFVSIEAGKLRVEKAPGALPDILENLRDRMATLADQRKITLAVDLPPAPVPPLELDKRRIDQVLTNLTGNALKHTPEGGAVTITLETRDGAVRVEVKDTGEGIPAADLPRIFEQFYQVEAHASKREGLGLGLAIAREIVQAHGGEIGVHSDGAGKGSRFWFTLPVPGGKKTEPPPK